MPKAENLHAIVMKFGNLNFVETSGHLQACNGTALPLYINSRFQRFLILNSSNCSERKFSLINGTLKYIRTVQCTEDSSIRGTEGLYFAPAL